MFTQNEEEKHILQYFGTTKGTLLDIGANDGKTFSNSLRLIQLGWKAVLVEPVAMSVTMCRILHKDNKNVQVIPRAIGTINGTAQFFESGVHPPAGEGNYALLSTMRPEEKDKWNAYVEFREKQIDVIDIPALHELCGIREFDFISIDAEGMDLEILRQINLSATKLLCIEWNLVKPVREEILAYCQQYGISKLIYESPENLLIAR